MVFAPYLDARLDEPLYRQLYRYFEGLIAAGNLEAGERLPATRELAGQLKINRTTVSAAYELLEEAGLLSGQVGRGSFVAVRAESKAIDWSSLLIPAGMEASPSSYRSAATISFAASRPPEELFPVDDFRRSCEEVLASGRLNTILQLGSAGGYEPLRRYLIDEAREERTFGESDDLLITNGCQQALDLLRRVVVRVGTRVGLEDPVYPGLKNVLLQGRAELVGLPCAEDLRASRASLAVFTPNFQNPTGNTLSRAERESILAMAHDEQIALIENDIYSALRYEGAPIPSLRQLAPDSGIVMLRSFSKVAFPGLRLGWVIGPRQVIAAMREAKQLTDLHSDQFSQAVMLRFAESGRLAAHVAKMVEAGRTRLRATLESLPRFMPEGTRWTRPEGGMNLWVTLPRGFDAATLLTGAQQRGVAYLPGRVFAVHQGFDNAFRLSFGGSHPEQIREGARILGSVFESDGEWRSRAEQESAPALV